MAEKVWGRCFNFESPIKIEPVDDDYIKTFLERIASTSAREFDNKVYSAVLAQRIDVNREELVRALNYDRGQYEKGYADGLKNADIVHGKWTYKSSSEQLGGTDATYDYECSACNSLALEDSNYCPWCGALMDGERRSK